MKRDMDLVRRILRAAADAEGYFDAVRELSDEVGVTHDGVPGDLIHYHVRIMAEAGLLDGEVSLNPKDSRRWAFVHGLTWAGQDMLAAVRSDTVWGKTKAALLKTVGDTTLAVIKATAEGAATAMIRQALP
jgi:hypothetical protein